MGGVISSPIKSVLSAVSGSKPAAAAPQVDAPKPQPITSPTTAEVDQGEATRLLKAKRRGRSMTILTSPSGVSDQTTLSTKTLLGA
jgi:hypothetical protein